jgi:hypothetical protein
MELLARGLPPAEVAAQLGVSLHTLRHAGSDRDRDASAGRVPRSPTEAPVCR